MSNLKSKQWEQRLPDELKGPSSWNHGDHINPLTLIEAAEQFGEDTISRDKTFLISCCLLHEHVKKAATIVLSGKNDVVPITLERSTNEENMKIARETKGNLRYMFGYCEPCADAALQWFVTRRSKEEI